MMASKRPGGHPRTPYQPSRDLDLMRIQHGIWVRTRDSRVAVEGLFQDLTRDDLLAAAWQRVRSSPGAESAGVDGMRCSDWPAARRLSALRNELQSGTYAPLPARPIDLPRPRGKGPRRIGVLVVEDRIVHTAMRFVLEPVLDPRFHPSSFGYRPGRSSTVALQELRRQLGALPHDAWVWGHDVQDCFPSIRHRTLLRQLRRFVRDPQVETLLRTILRLPGGEGRRFRARGILQGSPLSPMLCNLALHSLDAKLGSFGRKHPGGTFLRYADDLIFVGNDRKSVRRLAAGARGACRRLGLRLVPSSPGAMQARDGIRWLGVDLAFQPGSWSPAESYRCRIPPDKADRWRAEVQQICSRIRHARKRSVPHHHRGPIDASPLRNQLLAWFQAYAHTDNAGSVFRDLEDAAESVLGSTRGADWRLGLNGSETNARNPLRWTPRRPRWARMGARS